MGKNRVLLTLRVGSKTLRGILQPVCSVALVSVGHLGAAAAIAASPPSPQALTSGSTQAATTNRVPPPTALATTLGFFEGTGPRDAANIPDFAHGKRTPKAAAIAPLPPAFHSFATTEDGALFPAETSALAAVSEDESVGAAAAASALGDALMLSEFLPTDNAEAISQAPEPEIFSDVVSQSATNAADIPWRFVLEPYVYLPLETSGDVTIRNIEVPYDFSLGDILESLTFAFYGRFEAWKGPWAFVFDGYYFDTLESDSRNIPTAALPPGLLPPQITQVPLDATAETAFLKLDFAGAYRFGDGNLANALSTAKTEFDLGPFVFDAIAGLRLYSFSNDIELSTPLGLERDFSRSDTFIEPMIGGRARWNFADNVAAIAAANISGFGIGTDLSVEGYAGVDWLFSGNTSLTATYRLTYIDYSEGSSGFNLFQHGPAIGVRFRF